MPRHSVLTKRHVFVIDGVNRSSESVAKLTMFSSMTCRHQDYRALEADDDDVWLK